MVVVANAVAAGADAGVKNRIRMVGIIDSSQIGLTADLNPSEAKRRWFEFASAVLTEQNSGAMNRR